MNSTDALNAVIDNYGVTSSPFKGPSFILPNGQYLDLSSVINHSDVEYWLDQQGLSIKADYTRRSGSPTLRSLGCIRVDTPKYYIQLPEDNITVEQYAALKDWIEFAFVECNVPFIEIMAAGTPPVRYRYEDDVDADYIVDRIRRYYITDHLYEAHEDLAEGPYLTEDKEVQDMLELKEAVVVSEKFDGTVKDEIRTDLLNKIYEVAQTPDWGYEDQSEVDDFMAPQVDITNTEDGKIKVEVRAEFSDYDSQRQMAEALDEIISEYDADAYFDDEDMGIMSAYLDVKLDEDLSASGATQVSNIGQHKRAEVDMAESGDDPEDSEMTEGIADEVRASQDKKDMTRRAIKMLKSLGGDYEDLVQEYKDAYGEDPLDEAYYGGAYDIDPEMYFTRDDYVDFAYQIIDEVAEDTGYTLDIEEINVIHPKHVRLIFSNEDGVYTTDIHIDYRRIRKPSDLSRYLDSAVKDIEGKIKEFNSMFEGLQLKVTESVNDFEEYSGNVTYNAYRMVSDMRHYLQSHPEEKSNVLNLRRQIGDIFNKAYLESVNESLEGEDGWSEEIVDLFSEFLRHTDGLSYEMYSTVRGTETGAKSVGVLVEYLKRLASQLDDIIGNLEGSEDVLEESTDKVNFKDAHICQGCGKPLSQCTCEVEEEDLKD